MRDANLLPKRLSCLFDCESGNVNHKKYMVHDSYAIYVNEESIRTHGKINNMIYDIYVHKKI